MKEKNKFIDQLLKALPNIKFDNVDFFRSLIVLVEDSKYIALVNPGMPYSFNHKCEDHAILYIQYGVQPFTVFGYNVTYISVEKAIKIIKLQIFQ